MNTGKLLKSLLHISNMTQKTFADSVFASPSKISKIISGKLLVTAAETKSFSEQAARIFAEELYDNNCYHKFRDIFPIIFDFNSRYDLNDFLYSAFQYTIEQDREAADDPRGRSHENEYYSGKQQILYLYCIILSDYLKRDRHELFESFSSMQKFFGYYAEMLDKIIVLPPDMQREIVFHQFFDPRHLKTLAHEHKSNILLAIFETELYTDLYRYETKIDASKPFLLVKDKFIMLFDKQIDGTPQLTLIRNPSELDNFYKLIMDKVENARCMTFNTDSIGEYLTREKAETDNLMVDEKIRLFLSSNPPGNSPALEDNRVENFYKKLLEGGTSVYMSADSLEDFLFRSEITIPVYSTVDLNLQSRINYLARIRDYLESIKPAPVYVINTPLNSLSLLINGKWSLISLVHPLSQRMKYHIFDSNLIGPELKNAAAQSDINIGDYIDRLISQAQKHKN